MKKILLIIFLLFIFLSFNRVQAAGLVPCGGTGESACEFCHFFVLFDNVYRFVLLSVVPGIAIVMIIIGGVLLLFGGESPERLNQAKQLFTYLAIGLVLIYGAWVLVNLFFQMIGVASWTNLKSGWWKIDCPVSGGE